MCALDHIPVGMSRGPRTRTWRGSLATVPEVRGTLRMRVETAEITNSALPEITIPELISSGTTDARLWL